MAERLKDEDIVGEVNEIGSGDENGYMGELDE
jgi:hypothetical protein